MSIKFTVSAPGKVILNGEHSVVYNKPALAGVVGLRNSLTFIETSDSFIDMNFDIFPGLQVRFNLNVINSFLTLIVDKFDVTNFLENLGTSHDTYLETIKTFLAQNLKVSVDENQKYIFENSLTAIIYLMAAIEMSKSPQPRFTNGFILQFTSEITAGAGLGSSAAYAVCLAAAFHTYSMVRNQPDFIRNYNLSASLEEKSYFLSTISSWALLSERIMHGNPSGLDNTICTFGNIVKFTKNPQKIEEIDLKSTFSVLLVNSGVNRNTLTVVQKVKQLRDNLPEVINSILNAIGFLVEDVVKILESEPSEENFEKLKRLFSINNNLLRSIDVSHPVLEDIFSISERNGFSCKLTGAGAGGYAIILLPPDYERSESYGKLFDELKEKSFEALPTNIGGEGLIISE